MSRWFRFYDDALNDPKILKLSDKLHRVWIGLLCIASKNDGQLPSLGDMALMIRMKPEKLEEAIKSLMIAGLIDETDAILSPHNWTERQYKSDSSAERMKRHRDRKRDVTVTVQSRSRSRADTEAEQSRAEAPAAAISQSEKVLRSDLAETLGPSRSLDLDRTAVWLSKGYSSTMIVEVVREVLARGTDVGSLNYFDAMLAERHANRQETPSERAAAKVDMDAVAAMFKKTGVWSKYAGPEPGMIGCRCSPEVLAKHDIIVPGMRRMDS